ncbi:MAG: TrbC/VirB2 family protein [Rickettsiales bacterium]|nr:TrbC/VirB2 family protein [Rickettsiales bacterium]
MKKNYLLTLLAMFFIPMIANAQTPFDQACEIFDCIMNDGIILVVATVAILFLGIGAFFGKVNWGLVLITTIAIVVISGAYQIAVLITNDQLQGGSCGDGTCDGILVQ